MDVPFPLMEKNMSTPIEISGVIEEIFPEQVISDRFKKREFILLHAPNPDYPEHIKVELVQDKCDLLNKYKKGQEVDLSLNLKGRMSESNGNYYNTIQCWRIMPSGGDSDDEEENLF